MFHKPSASKLSSPIESNLLNLFILKIIATSVASVKATYQFDALVVHSFEIFLQHDLLDPEGNSVKTQLASNVGTSELHVHSHNLHSTDSAVCN